MKKDFNETKAKLLVIVIPLVLIIVILLVMLAAGKVRNDKLLSDNKDLQESIKDYADSMHEGAVQAGTGTAVQKETPAAPPSDDSDSSDSSDNAADEKTPVPSASEMPKEEAKAPSLTPYKEVMEKGKTDYSKVEFNREEQLKEMMAYWEDNNQAALSDLAHLDRFKAMSWKLRGTADFYYYGNQNSSGQPEGKGIAVYADNQYYYGEWKDGVRSGAGVWFHYHIHETKSQTDLYTFHQYSGNWKNDLPEGEGAEHYDFELDNLKGNARYNSNLIGSYAAGLVNGDFYITTIDKNNKMQEWNATGVNGVWKYQNKSKDKNGHRPVLVDTADPDNYIWFSEKENANIGVSCILSKYKNQ